MSIETPPQEQKSELRITKRDLVISWLIWTFFSHSNYNYERLQATAFAHAMGPIIRRLYGGDKEQTAAALRRHLVFFNTSPDFGGVIHGVTIAMEEQKANGKEITDDAITSMKTGLMGPMAGIGDTIGQGILTPLFLALGISITGLSVSSGTDVDLTQISGNPLGPIIYFILISSASLIVGYLVYTRGYTQGRSLITDIFKSGLMDRVIVGASVLGNMVLGGLAAQFVVLFVGAKMNVGGEVIHLQQDVFDLLLPGLLPLGLIILTWWVLKRGFHPIKLMIIYVIVCLIGAFPFFGRSPEFVSDACGSSILQPYGPCEKEVAGDAEAGASGDEEGDEGSDEGGEAEGDVDAAAAIPGLSESISIKADA